jgi:hypothetical protein
MRSEVSARLVSYTSATYIVARHEGFRKTCGWITPYFAAATLIDLIKNSHICRSGIRTCLQGQDQRLSAWPFSNESGILLL